MSLTLFRARSLLAAALGLGLAGSACAFDRPQPEQPPPSAPAPPSPAAVSSPAIDLVPELNGTWELETGPADLQKVELLVGSKARNVDCAIEIVSSQRTTPRESCTVTKSGTQVRVLVKGALRLAAVYDPQGRLSGRLESGAATDVTLLLRDSTLWRKKIADAQQAAAAQQAAEVTKQNEERLAKLVPTMVPVPAGKFQMGSPLSEFGRSFSEGPQHEVSVEAFEISQTPVSVAQWQFCVDDHACQPSKGNADGAQPATGLSWNDAQAYVAWLSKVTKQHFRLPSEAEWEFAARAGTTTIRYWGDSMDAGKANCKGCGGTWQGRAAPVKSFGPNPRGLYDVLGTVWQLTQDCWRDSYKDAEKQDCGQRVIRGGSWYEDAKFSRSAERMHVDTAQVDATVGLRVVRSP